MWRTQTLSLYLSEYAVLSLERNGWVDRRFVHTTVYWPWNSLVYIQRDLIDLHKLSPLFQLERCDCEIRDSWVVHKCHALVLLLDDT
jgi:hypothetical protein